MLKPVDPMPGAPDERSVGALIHQLIEDAKAYARAEFALVKAIASAKAGALVLPAALLGVAFLCALAGVVALAFGVVMSLAWILGPLLAGVAGLVIFSAIAGGLAWFALQRLKDMR